MTAFEMGDTEETEPGQLLSALLDGELSATDEQRVRAWLDESPEGRAELAALADVRTMVRELPPVDPPFGFFERMLLDANREASAAAPASARHKRRRRTTIGGAIGAVAAVAAAFILVLGLTPASDSIVPPMEAFADRHGAMMTSPPAASPSTSPGSDGYEPVPATELDGIPAPYMAPPRLGAYTRTTGFRHDDIVHVVYTNGSNAISVYEQRGSVDWTRIPSNGEHHQLGATKAWETHMASGAVMVLELDGMVVTMVATAPDSEVLALAKGVPAPPAPSLLDRATHNCSELVRSFTGGV